MLQSCVTVINSHVNYTKPLNALLFSLFNCGVREAILILSGSRSHSDVIYTAVQQQVRLKVVHTRTMNWEYTAFQKLKQYQERISQIPDCYMMLHDTSIVSLGYPNVTRASFGTDYDVIIPSGATSNIMALSYFAVPQLNVKSYQSKIQAIYGEFRRALTRHFYSDRILQVSKRVALPDEDFYDTGVTRKRYYYPTFHVTKYVYEGPRFGDVSTEDFRVRHA